MSSTVLVGTQWGDEGKGKICDLIARDFDCVVRYQGGNNAGHTIVWVIASTACTRFPRASCIRSASR